MGLRVFVADPLPQHVLELEARWDGCPQGRGYGHRTLPFEFRTLRYRESMTQAEARAMLPRELRCAICGAAIALRDLPAGMQFGPDARPGSWPAVQIGGSRVWRRRDTGETLYAIAPGMAWDEGGPNGGWGETTTGTPLRPGDLAVPLAPDPRIRDASGAVARPRSIYGWQWVQACHARGTWLPRWHVALPGSTPWVNGYRGERVFPTFMYASNGQDMGNGYGTGWSADQWDDIATMTLSPSINWAAGSPQNWHGFLQRGELNPA